MLFYNLFYIAESQTESFDIMYISRRHAVKLVENPPEIVLAYANAPVLDRDYYALPVIPGCNCNERFIL